MLYRWSSLACLVLLTGAFGPSVSSTFAQNKVDLSSLKEGALTLKSAGPLAFGPNGLLFLGDPAATSIYAVDTGDRGPFAKAGPMIEGLDAKVAALLGTEASQIQIKEVAVNPASGNTYLSVARGRGPSAPAVLLRVTEGKISEVNLKGIPFSQASLPNVGKSAQDVITHLAYLKGKILVAGLSNEEWTSTLRAIPFPFSAEGNKGTGVQIYHGAHGKFETKAPVRVFAPYQIKGEDHLLAAYTCTPLVKFPVSQLKPGDKVKGTTIAELGNRNRPLSMIVYQKGGKDFVLMANSSRGMMKIALEGVESAEGIVKRVANTAGLKYTTLEGLSGVQKLDAYGTNHAVILVSEAKGMTLRTIDLP